jgi:hypothetical protein
MTYLHTYMMQLYTEAAAAMITVRMMMHMYLATAEQRCLL